MLTDVDTPSAKPVETPKPNRRWLQFRLRSLLVLATVLCVPLGWLGHRMEQVRREQAPATRRLKILNELESLGSHPWAGEYRKGLGLGISLILAPKSGYLYQSYSCMGLHEQNYGYVRESNGRLHLEFRLPKESDVLADELITVAWGSRAYLIPPDRMVDFCNDVNSGEGRLFGFHFLRRGGDANEVKGLPSVPDEFQQYLLASPIEATIIEVSARTAAKTPVILDCGKKHGLLPGMNLHFVEHCDPLQYAAVTRVEDERSEAILVRLLEGEPDPQVGWKLSTRCPWYTNKE